MAGLTPRTLREVATLARQDLASLVPGQRVALADEQLTGASDGGLDLQAICVSNYLHMAKLCIDG